jgi:serine phosphatase RsbU (regulator of sigma subunit)/anti-sigma regulatory factor (Ser/Thr protein kinase)
MTWFQRKKNNKENEVEVEPTTDQTALAVSAGIGTSPTTVTNMLDVDIAPDDPLLAHILSSPGIIQVDRLNLDSVALGELKEAQVRLAVPLISQGELIGLLNLGSRLSEADYSTDDFRLLSTLATQAAPALRVAQLARQQQAEARQRERMEQELRVARVVQQTLLPKEVPTLDGWQIDAYWQPARTVSGDFYDFIAFDDGRMGFIVADVTDKGVPAALVMATSRSVLRAVAERVVSPGAVLQQANNLLCPSMPAKMFVTCLYAVLDPTTGMLCYANAGHNPPFQHRGEDIVELRARGMPLGLLPDWTYEEKETRLIPGDNVMMYSDGLVEAHDTQGEMFGYQRMRGVISQPRCGEELIQCMLDELHGFTGPEWEQEDDVTFVTLNCLALPDPAQLDVSEQLLAEFVLPSRLGEEKQLIRKVTEAVAPLNLDQHLVERLRRSVAEATMNAMEHGNHFQEDKPVTVRVLAGPDRLIARVEDLGGDAPIPTATKPDLQAKLQGEQSARGWGLFLIQKMVDEMNTYSNGDQHVIELVLMR